MDQLGGGAGLLAHHVAEAGVGGERRREHLERDDPVEHLVAGPPDHRHAAGADLVDEPVPAGQQPAGVQCCLHGSHLPRCGSAIRLRECVRPVNGRLPPAPDRVGRARAGPPGHRRAPSAAGPAPAGCAARARMERMAQGPVAFVLGGGGLLGAVEVGMLRALFRAGIRPDLVLGTSVGALNGALVAADPTEAVIDRLVRLWALAGGQRGVRRLGRPASCAGSPPAPTCTRPAPLRDLLEAELGADTTFADLRGAVPVLRGQHRAGRRALVHSGPVVDGGDGLRRRCPGCCRRREVDGEHYLDGGIVNSIPVGRAVAVRRHADLRAPGRPDRPAADAAPPAVGGRPGLVRDRPPAPVRPRDGRAARRRRRCTCCPPAALEPRDDSPLGYRDFAAVGRRIAAPTRPPGATCATHAASTDAAAAAVGPPAAARPGVIAADRR